MTTIVVGGQWGDEGKGKVIAYLCHKDAPDIIARGGVGPNAGHTVRVGDRDYKLRMVPSGFVYERAKLLLGAGLLIDPEVLLSEIDMCNLNERIKIDYRCGIIDSEHKSLDKSSEHLAKKIGTTGTGCGPANRDRVMRTARQAKDIDALKPYLTDVPRELNEAMDRGKRVLVEGSQGFYLSLFYGTYPFVTSKDTSASAIASDVGIGPARIDDVIVVFKSFPTRVGEGPFPTEMSQEEAERRGIVEYGTVTGRRRRIGYFDFELARYSCMVNSATQIALSKVDAFDPQCKGARSYDELTPKVKEFVAKIEKETGRPVTLISTGAEMTEIVDLRDEKAQHR